MEMQRVGLIILVLAGMLAVIGLVLLIGGDALARLVRIGTIRIEGSGFTCLIPILASILLSVIGTVVLTIIIRLINR
jgi:ABC-type phosphate transport system substrate-binding protein